MIGESDCSLGPGAVVREHRRPYQAPAVEWVEPLCRAVLGGSPGAGDSGSSTLQNRVNSPVIGPPIGTTGPAGPGDQPSWPGGAGPDDPPQAPDPFQEAPSDGGGPFSG